MSRNLIVTPMFLLWIAATCQAALTPTTRSTEARDTEVAAPTTAPTTPRPAVAAAPHHDPTPAELARRIKQRQVREEARPKVALFDFSSGLAEKPADFSLFADQPAQTLQAVIDRIRQSRLDKDIRAVLVILGDGDMNLAQAQEIRDALADVTRSGKPTFAYADQYDTVHYTAASGARTVCMLEGGQLVIPGVGMELTFLKGLFDKVGLTADAIQIGEYKGADEGFTRTQASEQLRGQMNRLTQALYAQIVEGIAHARNLSPSVVRQAMDQAILSARAAKECGLIDELVDEDALRELIGKSLSVDGRELALLSHYAQPQREPIDLSSPFALFAMLSRRPTISDKPAVALIYADGMIVDGDGGDSMFGSAVGSESMRRALRMADRDPRIKAVVLRIDSPGGSAIASEAMWQAARRLAKNKPLIVSVGHMAASGGYYLATAGDRIFADPTAIVGSIGVVGGKIVYKDLLDKLGIRQQAFTRGANADLFSSDHPFTDAQRKIVTDMMKDTYDLFTARVLAMRGKQIRDIDKVARGRIFIASQALKLGLVDELGGLQAAIAHAASQGHLHPGDYLVRVLPPPRTLADLFAGDALTNGPDAVLPAGAAAAAARAAGISPSTAHSALLTLSPHLRAMLGQQLQLIELFQQSPVLLVAPYTIAIK